MKLQAPFSSIVIDLESEDQQKLQNLIKLQDGDMKKKLSRKDEDQKIINIPWKKLKLIIANDIKNYT